MRSYLSFALTVFFLSTNGGITAQTTAPQPAAKTQITPSAGASVPKFDSQRAMADLVKQVEGGPRLPDSPGILATRQLITSTLEKAGWTVYTQDFEVVSPMLGHAVKGQNLFALPSNQTTATGIISAHYDTRPYADMDPDPARRKDPVPGANDGASGVAVLLELGRLIPALDLNYGVCLAFWDVEDHGAAGESNGFCLGSRHFALNMPAQVKDFQWGINLDMVGAADLKLPMEGFSYQKAPRLTLALWNIGNSFYPNTWRKERGPMIYDDHMPFLTAGKPYIDVIDIQYQPWHTVEDTPDKCDPKSLEIVGDSVLKFIQKMNTSPEKF